jgi:hypothetical protein
VFGDKDLERGHAVRALHVNVEHPNPREGATRHGDVCRRMTAPAGADTLSGRLCGVAAALDKGCAAITGDREHGQSMRSQFESGG